MSTASGSEPASRQSLTELVHELNNVLSAVLGYAEIVHADASGGSVDARDATQILAAARRAIELTDALAALISDGGTGVSPTMGTGSEPEDAA